MGVIRIINDDCNNVMEKLQENSIDMGIADPPYFTVQYKMKEKWKKSLIEFKKRKRIDTFEADWDKWESEEHYQEFTNKWVRNFWRVLKPSASLFVHCIIAGNWCGLPNIVIALKETGFKMMNDISWCKLNGQPNLEGIRFAICTEHILWAIKKVDKTSPTFNYKELKALNRGKQMRDFWLIPTEPSKTIHPTPKPKKLINNMIIACSKEGDVILDAFMGSGVVERQCIALGRNCIGCETNGEYYMEAKNMLQEEIKQHNINLSLFFDKKYILQEG